MEFYVGYLPQAPAGVAKLVRRTIFVLLGAGALIAALVATLQAPFDQGTYEFGVTRSFEGRVALEPYPHLLVDRPGSEETSSYALALPGKYGAERVLSQYDGLHVALEGSLLYRDDATMIELVADSIQRTPEAPRHASAAWTDGGEVELQGEIVDSKCFLGLMKPGRKKPHRSCAVACIRGGIPAALYVEDEKGAGRVVMLGREPSSSDSAAAPIGTELLEVVGQPVVASGRLRLDGDVWILETSADRVRRRDP